MRRTPQTQVDDGTNTAGFQEGFIVRPHITDFRDEIVPGFFQTAFPEIVGAVRMAEGRAEPQFSVIADIEASVSGSAMKKMIAVRMRKFRIDQFVTVLLEGYGSVSIGLFNRHNLFR